jgi:hypothetical protein
MNPTKYDLAALEPLVESATPLVRHVSPQPPAWHADSFLSADDDGVEAFRQIWAIEVHHRRQAQWEANYWREMAEAGADDLSKSARALRTEHRRFVIAALVCAFAVPLAVGRIVDVAIRWWAL